MTARRPRNHPEGTAYNWLVNRIVEEQLSLRLSRYARGVLVDIGCGVKPYAHLTKALVTQHIGVDHTASEHEMTAVDVTATAYDTTLPASSADTVLCTAVLEHLERPEEALLEMHRILRPGGCILLTAPLFWHLHEEPRDFYRFTRYGLESLLLRTGFEVAEVVPLSGFIVTFCQEMCYYAERFRGRFSGWLISLLQRILQEAGWRMRRHDLSHEFTWMYLVVAHRPWG